MLAQKNTDVASMFPTLSDGGAGASGKRNRWEIEEIPDDWVQIKGDEAEQWALMLALDTSLGG
jgi:hypothetical protein